MLVRLNKSQHSTMAWTPDGKALAYSDNAYPGGGIFLFSMETTKQRRLTTIPDPSMNDRYLQISPDGKLLAFCRLTPGKNSEAQLGIGFSVCRWVAETRKWCRRFRN